jgi:DNA-binding MarR family transcriptional regulator
MVDDLVARLHAAGYHDITAAHQSVFENIDREGTRLTTLAERSGITHQSMGELVHALERGGYLQRRPDPSDRRARLIHLTPKGSDLVRHAVAHSSEIEATWHQQFQGAGHDIDLKALLETALTTHTVAEAAEQTRPADAAVENELLGEPPPGRVRARRARDR